MTEQTATNAARSGGGDRRWRRKGRGRGLRRDRRGQSVVEFVIAIPIVLALLAGIVEFGRHYYTRLTLRHAVADAARFAVTGQTLTDSLSNPLTRAQSIVQVIRQEAYNLNVQVSDIAINPPGGGQPGEVVTISATYRYNFSMPTIASFFTPGYVDFTVTTAMKNEPVF